MQPINLMIGDRVVYENEKITNLHGKTGTIVSQLPNDTSRSTISIKFDERDKADFFILANIRRQPIEVGSHVRFNMPNHMDYIGKVDSFSGEYAWIDKQWYFVSQLARVERPTPKLKDQPPHEFMPGDRIYNTAGLTGLCGTIYAVEKERTIVDFDNGCRNPWTHESVRQFFQRQTIQVGCWVRVHGNAGMAGMNQKCIGNTFKVERIEGDCAINSEHGIWTMKHLARIAEPIKLKIQTTPIGGLTTEGLTVSIGSITNQSFEIMPDIRHHHTGKLQQAWRNMGDGSIDWRDVPTMKGPKTFKRGQPVRYIAPNNDDITNRNGYVVNIDDNKIEAYEVYFPIIGRFKWCCGDNLE